MKHSSSVGALPLLTTSLFSPDALARNKHMAFHFTLSSLLLYYEFLRLWVSREIRVLVLVFRGIVSLLTHFGSVTIFSLCSGILPPLFLGSSSIPNRERYARKHQRKLLLGDFSPFSAEPIYFSDFSPECPPFRKFTQFPVTVFFSFPLTKVTRALSSSVTSAVALLS